VEATLPKRLQRSKPLAWGIALLLLAGIAVSGVLVLKPLLVSKQAEAKSLAVLSFENLGTEADAYLASGLAEDLAIKLRKLAGFRVASSEDIRRLSKEELLPKQIASRLKVEYALGGSLLKAGDRIRVNVEVIEEASGDVIWSEQFHREFTDIHEFHDEVSQKIAKALKVQLSPAEQLALKDRPTDSPEAYDHYLRGRHYYYNVTFRDNELAEREFERALQLDPDYPLALAGLADAYVQRYKERFDYDEYWLDSSKVLIDRALELDSELAEAYESRAEALWEEDNWLGALEAAEKARKTRPDWDEPYVHLGNIYKQRGKRSQALAMFDTALSIRASVEALCGKGNVFQTRGQMDSAKAAYQAALELNPDHYRPYLELAWLSEELSEGEEMERLVRRAIEVRPDRSAGYEWLSWILFNRGSVQEGEKLLRGFVERFPYNWDAYAALYDYVAWRRGDYPAAVKIVEEAVSRNPKRVWPHLLLASSYAEKMSPEAESDKTMPASEKAVLAVERALALRPNSGRVLDWAGYVYISLNRLDEAMDYYNRALEVRPGSSDLLYEIARQLTKVREYEKAAEYGRRAVKQSPGIARYYGSIFRRNLLRLNRGQEYFDILQQAAREHGDDPDFLLVLSSEQRAAGKYRDAIITAQRALKLKRTHLALARLAFTLWMSGDAQSGLDKFNEAPDTWASALGIVAILKSEGRFAEIEPYLESIKEYTPGHVSGLAQWAEVAGQYYMSMRRYDDALAVYTEYRKSGKETWSGFNSLTIAECYRQKGAIDSTRHLLEGLVDTSLRVYRPFIFMDLAKLEAVETRDLTIAIELAERALAEQDVPNDFVTQRLLLSKLLLHYGCGRVNDVESILPQLQFYTLQPAVSYRKAQIAAAIGSDSAGLFLDHAISDLVRLSNGEYISVGNGIIIGEACGYCALALARAGEPDQAAREIKRALKLEPERADIAYHAACAYSLIGDTALALQWLETAVERGYQELWWARVDPDLDPLRKLPRFQEIMNEWDGRVKALFD